MQRLWSEDELDEHWTLLPADLTLLTDLPDSGKLGLAAQLACWRQQGRFPDDEADLAPAVVGHLATQVGVGVDALDGYDWVGRTDCGFVGQPGGCHHALGSPLGPRELGFQPLAEHAVLEPRLQGDKIAAILDEQRSGSVADALGGFPSKSGNVGVKGAIVEEGAAFAGVGQRRG